MNALEVDHLWTGYNKGAPVLQDMIIQVAEGEIVAVIGPNGAGKTTLLRTVCGLLPCWQGEIRIWGQAVPAEPCFRRTGRGVALVPEGARVFADLTVSENLLMGAYLRKIKTEIQKDQELVLDLFPQLAGRLSVKAGSLSGGQRQMLAIGRGLMSNSRLLMLDEPSLGLAPLVVDEVFEALRRIQSLGATCLLVEQNAVKAFELAERAYVLSEGRVVASGRTADLISDKEIVDSYFGT